MSKNVTVELLVRKSYQVEVADDFDFEDSEALTALAQDSEDNRIPDTEDWEEVIINDDDEGGYYTA